MIRATAVLLVVVFGFVLGASAQDFKVPEAKGRVYFKNLKNGAAVSTTFKVEFGVDGLRLRPAGEDPLDHTSGHHHLLIDGRPVPPGQLVPFDDSALEQSIEQLADRLGFAVDDHEVVLHGRCAACASATTT